LEFVNYYSKFGDFQAAEKLLKECQTAFEQDKRLSLSKRDCIYRMFILPATKTISESAGSRKDAGKRERRLSESIT
jgi:hypothetical protein